MRSLKYFVGILSILIISCNEDPINIRSVLVDEEGVYISSIVNNDNVILNIEALQDSVLTADDICTVSFDVNNNNQIDINLDFGISSPPEELDLCDFYILGTAITSPCGDVDSGASYNVSVGTSMKLNESHLIWEIIIPKNVFLDYPVSGVTFVVIAGFTIYNLPANANLNSPLEFRFDETYRLALN